MGNNDLINIYVTWKEDKGSDFTLEHSWRLLKDQFKQLEQCTNTIRGVKDKIKTNW